jgi:hypothetical protein
MYKQTRQKIFYKKDISYQCAIKRSCLNCQGHLESECDCDGMEEIGVGAMRVPFTVIIAVGYHMSDSHITVIVGADPYCIQVTCINTCSHVV